MTRVTAPVTRFMRYVEVQSNGCWIWTGHVVGSKGKRPIFRHTTRSIDPKMYGAVWAYQHWNGPIPEGMELDHFVCQNGMCVNPDHVEPVTPQENQARRRLKVCPSGHDLTGEEHRHPGTKGCYTCAKIRQRQRYAASRGGQQTSVEAGKRSVPRAGAVNEKLSIKSLLPVESGF